MAGLKIDVVFDTACPWCFIGKRRLDRALERRPHLTADIRWWPFLLNPDMAAEGMARGLYLEQKFGGAHRVQRLFGAVVQAGLSEDIDFDFSRLKSIPNTVASHRLIHFARNWDRQSAVVEALFSAYFLESRDIGDIAILTAIGEECGLPGDQVIDYLDSGRDTELIQEQNARAHRLGVNGVPSYLFEEAYALAGAQEPDILLRLIDLAQETQAVAALSRR